MPTRKTRKKKKEVFWPPKYYKGLTLKQKRIRKKEIEKFGAMDWNQSKAYVGFKTDQDGTTKKKSTYTEKWDALFPEAKTLKERSKVTGVPTRFLTEVYNRGMAAWRTGHRPFASQQAWSYPRVSSYLLCGKTHYTADSDLVRQAKKESAAARKWFKRCKTSKITQVEK